MKIALVSPYDFASYGGVTTHVSHLATEFQRSGHEVHIIAPCSGELPVDPPAPLHRLGHPVSFPANGSIARVGVGSRLGKEVGQIMASGGFDIVHLHEPLVPALPLAVLRASRATNIGTFHAFRRSNIAYLYGKPILRYFFGKLHGRITVSHAARDFVSERFRADYRVIPNGIDFSRFSCPRARLAQFDDGRLNVLFVGRLEKRKGLSYLLRAWGRVHEELPEARLLVVGGGGGLEHYRSFVGARGDIIFTGRVSDEALLGYYHSADVFCAPSTGGESFGMVLLEAMAAAKPLVTTNIEGYSEVVSHGKQGLLVPPKNADALADALLVLLRDPELRATFGTAGRLSAERYAWPRVAEQVLDYYGETIHRRTLLRAVRRPRFRRMRRVAGRFARLFGRRPRFRRMRRVASDMAHLLTR